MNLAAPTELTGDPLGSHDPAKGSFRPPPTPAELAPHFPQLEILELIGQGGMGCVFKARQPQLNRLVALKILPAALSRDAAFAARFTREAQALAALSHTNIVTIFDFGHTGKGDGHAAPFGQGSDKDVAAPGFFFLLMEYVDGVNLRQALKAGRFTPEQALAIVPPLCDALQFAHERGIVHRDIKPENLLLDKDGRIKVADFGIAKMLAADDRAASQPPDPTSPSASAAGKPPLPSSLTGDSAAGTPGYMAPEQKSTPQKVDRRADIYSMGVVFYEMLTGELPGENLQPPSRKVQIDVRLDEIVLRALEHKPELRYQTAAEMRTQVETIGRTPPPRSPDRPPAAEPSAVSRSPMLSLVLTLSSLLLPPALCVVFLLTGHRWAGLDLDAQEAFYAGVFGLPLSGGLGVLLSRGTRLVLDWLGFDAADGVSSKGRPWFWPMIAGCIVLPLSELLGGGALALLQLAMHDSPWHPGGEFAWTVCLAGGAVLTAAAATLIGLEILRRIRRAAGRLRDQFSAIVLACFWPAMLLAMLACAPSILRDRDLREWRAAQDAKPAGVVRTEETLRREITRRLAEAGWQVEGLFVSVSPDLKRAECRFAKVLKGGFHYVPFNASLRLKSQGAGLWLVEGAGEFRDVRFSVVNVSSMQALAPAAFGPVIERIVRHNRPGPQPDSMIDFDTGRLVTPPQPREADWNWVVANGIDAIGDTSASVRGLAATGGTVVAPATSNAWDNCSPGQARQMAMPLSSTEQLMVVMPATNSQPDGHIQVEVTFTEAGSKRFAEITGANIRKRLAMIFDGQVLSAPVIMSELHGKAVITGNLAAAMADVIVKALNPVKDTGRQETAAAGRPAVLTNIQDLVSALAGQALAQELNNIQAPATAERLASTPSRSKRDHEDQNDHRPGAVSGPASQGCASFPLIQ